MDFKIQRSDKKNDRKKQNSSYHGLDSFCDNYLYKWTNKKDRLKTKQINKNLDIDHSLFFINYEDFDDEYFYYFNPKI